MAYRFKYTSRVGRIQETYETETLEEMRALLELTQAGETAVPVPSEGEPVANLTPPVESRVPRHDELTCTYQEWLEHANKLMFSRDAVGAPPLKKVTLTGPFPQREELQRLTGRQLGRYGNDFLFDNATCLKDLLKANWPQIEFVLDTTSPIYSQPIPPEVAP
jgi:hypothetical protein